MPRDLAIAIFAIALPGIIVWKVSNSLLILFAFVLIAGAILGLIFAREYTEKLEQFI